VHGNKNRTSVCICLCFVPGTDIYVWLSLHCCDAIELSAIAEMPTWS